MAAISLRPPVSGPGPLLAGAAQVVKRNTYAAVPLVLAVVLFVANLAVQPAFVSRSNWAPTMAVLAPFVFTALGQAIPVMSGNGGLDLSVGPFAGFVTVMIAGVFVPDGLGAPEVLVPLVVLLGLGAGAVNGSLVGVVRLPPIIATLGTYLFFTGMGTQVLQTPGGSVPGWLTGLNASYGPVPGTLVALVGASIVWLIFTRGSYMRNLLAIGGDERAAYTAGVNLPLARIMAYAIGGLFTAIGGMLLCGLIQSGDGTVGASYTISSITAVALGGIALGGGKGGLLGAGLGGVVLFLIQNLLTVSKVSVFDLDIVNGALLVVALAVNGSGVRLRRRATKVPQLTPEAPMATNAGDAN